MVYQIKVQLQGASKPPIWRRFLVPSTASFKDLHYIILGGFGWEGGHLFEFTEYPYTGMLNIFEPLDEIFGSIPGEEPSDVASQTPISYYLNERSPKMMYTYDLGDNWKHLITLEDPNVKNVIDPKQAHCIGGKGTCPPEDCGGIGAFNFLKEFVMTHPEEAIEAAENEEPEKEIAKDSLNEDEKYALEQISWYGPFFEVVKGKPDFTHIDLQEFERIVSGINISGARKRRTKRKSDDFDEFDF